MRRSADAGIGDRHRPAFRSERPLQHRREGGARRKAVARGEAVAERDEPLYRVTVALDAQTATAYGAAQPLQPGMTLKADVLIETRRVWQWVLDPLYALRGGGAA